jgi:hypothetical protein
MANAGKRGAEGGVKLDKSAIDQLDLSKVPIGKKEETAEVTAQWNGTVRSPCNGEWWHFSGLSYGWNLLRDPTGCVWNQYID